ncbi:hypothetical protein DPMN_112224 [Dreissena polymorpha]|uniref:Uncharacterized protein n=1 Tax=Dreissena polymorpha TaxID=45954 RepID=A0A9D4KG11_DREPO|nr:hypothetical protein DPMN_112224 [Dreissena polymorpha]
MWTDGQRTKTNPKTLPEQSVIFQLFQEINKTMKTAPPPWQPYTYKTNLFTKFHDDWATNVTSTVHVIQLTGTIFQLNSLFKCFHYINIEKNAPPTGGNVLSPIWTIFELVRHINKTNVFNNFHDDWAKMKTAPPTGGHLHEDWALNVTSTVFELDRYIIGTNLLTKFHEDRTIHEASRVFTNKCGRTDIRRTDGRRTKTGHKSSPKQSGKLPGPPGNHVFQRTGTIFKLNSLFTCFHYVHMEKNAPPIGGHVFSPIWTIFELSNFHDWAKIVTSRPNKENCPPTSGHVFQRTGTTFELNQHIIKTNILTNFELDRYFIGKKLLTKFHEDRTINVASRVFTNNSHLSNQRNIR